MNLETEGMEPVCGDSCLLPVWGGGRTFLFYSSCPELLQWASVCPWAVQDLGMYCSPLEAAVSGGQRI